MLQDHERSQFRTMNLYFKTTTTKIKNNNNERKLCKVSIIGEEETETIHNNMQCHFVQQLIKTDE
jgi:hypothetical protein